MSVAEYLEDLFGLKGQVAVVIGGAGALGASLGMGLAKAGAHIVVADLTEEGCIQRVGEIEDAGGAATAATVDIRFRFDFSPGFRRPRDLPSKRCRSAA